MKRYFTTLLIFTVAGFSGQALADADSELTAKTLCAGCHGPNGISTNPLWPNLAGQHSAYTAVQLRAYRDGTRTDPNMNALVSNLSDDEIDALAEYYAKLPGGG